MSRRKNQAEQVAVYSEQAPIHSEQDLDSFGDELVDDVPGVQLRVQRSVNAFCQPAYSGLAARITALDYAAANEDLGENAFAVRKQPAANKTSPKKPLTKQETAEKRMSRIETQLNQMAELQMAALAANAKKDVKFVNIMWGFAGHFNFSSSKNPLSNYSCFKIPLYSCFLIFKAEDFGAFFKLLTALVWVAGFFLIFDYLFSSNSNIKK